MNAQYNIRRDPKPLIRFAQQPALLLTLLLFAVSTAWPTTVAWAQRCREWGEAKIPLQTRLVDFSAGLGPENVFVDHPADLRHVLMRFREPLALKDHIDLDGIGIQLVEYLQDCTYIASLTQQQWNMSAESRSDSDVRLGGTLDWRDKVSLDIQRGDYSRWAWLQPEDGSPATLKVLIAFHRDVTRNQARRALGKMKGVFEKERQGLRTWACVVEIGYIDEIAGVDGVRRIEQGPIPFYPLNEEAREAVKTDAAQLGEPPEPPPEYRVSGAGVQLGICDKGVAEGHFDFFEVVSDNGVFSKGDSRVYNSPTGGNLHGTAVASVAAGSGFDSPEFSLRGHAPEAEIWDYVHFFDDTEKHHDAIVCDKTDVTNHSYIQSFHVDGYGVVAEGLDILVRGDAFFGGVPIPARPQVWGAGNNGFEITSCSEKCRQVGYQSVFTSAKNTISVGSIDTNGRPTRSSSIGPTLDGRIKPDIVAPGCRSSTTSTPEGIHAAKASTDGRGYTHLLCGTSMAAPVVTGIIGLMMDQYERTYGVIPDLRPSTFKAMLVNTAVDQVKEAPYSEGPEYNNPDTGDPVRYFEGPDYITGFGRVDAKGACDVIAETNRWRESSFPKMDEGTRRVHRWCVWVPQDAETGPLQVTLAWDDEPGSTGPPHYERKLINDLDLHLVSPSGQVVYPWLLKPLPLKLEDPPPSQAEELGEESAEEQPPVLDLTKDVTDAGEIPQEGVRATPDVDRYNNVEMVTDKSGQPGLWHVVVDYYDLPSGNAQPYSLAASHDFLPLCPKQPDHFCEQFPALCPPMAVCDKYPWICESTLPAELSVEGNVWAVDIAKPTPVSEICKFLGSCPRCDGKSWEFCSGWQMYLGGIPNELVVVLFDQEGEIIGESGPVQSGFTDRVVSVDSTYPGQEFFLAFPGPSGEQFEEIIEVIVDIGPLTDSTLERTGSR